MSQERARDQRSSYDYTGATADVPESLAALTRVTRGEVRFDAYSRKLYATDASIYECTPLAVVFPVDTDDVAAVVRHCFEHEIPVLPRGGGTSLAGQAVNKAVILDCTRSLNEIRSIDPEQQRCTAEPGVILGELTAALEPYNLTFGPDPAWADKSALGGAIGNNSTGAHSLAYGKTDEYIESCEVVLADGTQTTLGWVTRDELAARADSTGDITQRLAAYVDRVLVGEAETIRDAFPAIHRNVSGYNLDRLLADAQSGEVNLARLLAGSEGTLGIVTAATIRLEPLPNAVSAALLSYDDLLKAMADVPRILSHEPAAIESIDDVLLDLARETGEFGPLVEALPGEPEALLLVEFFENTDAAAEQRLTALLADRIEGTGTEPVRAREALTASDPDTRATFWKLRKSGLPILLSRTSDEKHIAFVEDTAVPAENLRSYVADVRAVLDAHDTYASFYAHAGPGCLHIRPLLNTKTAAGVATMEAIADEISDLVIEYGGSISGEHGDGRARTQWNRKQYGDAVFALFCELKAICDPAGILNPGQVCGEVSMTDDLRFGPTYEYDASFEPELVWENDNGMQGMVELCHGCGGCRGDQHTTGGVMCPTYRASREEITSTRGRANLLRQAMSGGLPREEVLSDSFREEVLDLCIGCKGCARDCPSEVDMAKLKAEVTHAYHEEHGIDRRTNLFGNIHRVSAIGSAFAPVSNWVANLPAPSWLAEQSLGIARERELPPFHRETFLDWAHDRPDPLDPDVASDVVYFLPDTFTNYHYPARGRAAVAVLEAADIAVHFPDQFLPSGRAAYSVGCIDRARERVKAVQAEFNRIEATTALLTLEPSDAVLFQSDAYSLCGSEITPLAERTASLCGYLDIADVSLPVAPGEAVVTYHGHCHQKSTGQATHGARVLADAGWTVDSLDSGCCGMAGSFGYEAEHYAMSEAIGEILCEQIDESPGEIVVAPGASCQTQVSDLRGGRVMHPVELLAEGLQE